MSEPHACSFNSTQRCLKGAGCAAHGIECMRRVSALSFSMLSGWEKLRKASDQAWEDMQLDDIRKNGT